MSALVTVDRDKCVGSGQCVMSAATTFDQNDDDGLVVVLQSELADAAEIAQAREAANVCPGRAITVSE